MRRNWGWFVAGLAETVLGVWSGSVLTAILGLLVIGWGGVNWARQAHE